MNDEFLILNIREYLKQGESGENILKPKIPIYYT